MLGFGSSPEFGPLNLVWDMVLFFLYTWVHHVFATLLQTHTGSLTNVPNQTTGLLFMNLFQITKIQRPSYFVSTFW